MSGRERQDEGRGHRGAQADANPFRPSGIRIGTPAITTRGLKENDMEAIVDLIDEVIKNYENETVLEGVAEKVNAMMSDRPLFS